MINNTKFEKALDFFESTKNFWGIFLTIISILISIFTSICNPNNLFISISIVSCQIIVLIMYVILIGNIKSSKKVIDNERQRSIDAVNGKDIRINELRNEKEKLNSFINDCIIFNKCIDKRTNNFLTLVPDQMDNYYTALDYLDSEFNLFDAEVKSLTNEESIKYKSRLEREIQICEEKMFDLYKRFVKEIIEDTKHTIEKLLKLNNHNESVVITLKLFNETFSSITDNNKLFAYNAFRDKKTYNDAVRELGKRRYSIQLNDALSMCLHEESYIRNDIKKDDCDYQNEYFPNVLEYFNSTAVVPVISDYKKDKNIFGFLCCDTLATQENEKVFNKQVTDLMYSAALSIGMLLDALNVAWLSINNEPDDFISTICKRTYVGGE